MAVVNRATVEVRLVDEAVAMCDMSIRSFYTSECLSLTSKYCMPKYSNPALYESEG
jgi:hypothetical protein